MTAALQQLQPLRTNRRRGRGGGAPPAAPAALFGPHRWCGCYTQQEMIGEGSFKREYRAVDGVSRTDVALAVYRADPRALVRLGVVERHRAVRAIGPHPNLVQVIDAGLGQDTDGANRIIVVTELLTGITVADILAASEHPLPPSVVASMASGVLSALYHLHAAGLVHNDPRPGNIFLDLLGNAKLSDRL